MALSTSEPLDGLVRDVAIYLWVLFTYVGVEPSANLLDYKNN